MGLQPSERHTSLAHVRLVRANLLDPLNPVTDRYDRTRIEEALAEWHQNHPEASLDS